MEVGDGYSIGNVYTVPVVVEWVGTRSGPPMVVLGKRARIKTPGIVLVLFCYLMFCWGKGIWGEVQVC